MNIALLGSTGSIGRQVLDVASRFPDIVRVVALAANTNVPALVEQARAFNARYVVVADEQAYPALVASGLPETTHLGCGLAELERLVALDEVDLVLNALVGARGLRISYNALIQGKRLALANKESLVVGGDLIMPLVSHTLETINLIPVDSEHSALFQCLLGEDLTEVDHIWLTASGGPFRGRNRKELALVTKEEALSHPTWLMGPKISIDSATLMNKGLEIIEAHHLFALSYDQILVVVHPQSCIHSMVAYRDGSVKAHLGVTDMRIPIQYALSYPERWQSPAPALEFTSLRDLTFEAPDTKTFGCMALAIEAGRAGGTAPAVLNAANEIAVAAFLAGNCGFLDIERIVEAVLSYHKAKPVESIEELEEVDAWARDKARVVLHAASC